VHLAEETQHPWQQLPEAGKNIKGHEFHYSSLENLPADSKFAYRVARGHGIDGQHDGYFKNNLLACYAHLRSVNSNPWASRFVNYIRQVKQTQKSAELQTSH
jgi:cobyrinic acid a,c-diamide synthase